MNHSVMECQRGFDFLRNEPGNLPKVFVYPPPFRESNGASEKKAPANSPFGGFLITLSWIVK